MMDTTRSLLVRQTTVQEPERRDDYGLAKGWRRQIVIKSVSRLITGRLISNW
jgi:hypothetical protein